MEKGEIQEQLTDENVLSRDENRSIFEEEISKLFSGSDTYYKKAQKSDYEWEVFFLGFLAQMKALFIPY